MKIKHWQGYGSVDATKIGRTREPLGRVVLRVKVSGNHEWGLIREDIYDLVNWLVRRFDKSFKGSEYDVQYRILDSGTDFSTGNGIEYCIYEFRYDEE